VRNGFDLTYEHLFGQVPQGTFWLA